MRKLVTMIAATAVCAIAGTSSPAAAAELKDMLGKWKWTDYTIDVKECTSNPSGAGICATVIDGPQNKGMEMIRSKLESKSGAFFGHVAHPATQDIYDTRLMLKNADTWSLSGCVIKNPKVCATGDFVRVK